MSKQQDHMMNVDEFRDVDLSVLNINMSDPAVYEEIMFWARQMQEHATWIARGVVEDELSRYQGKQLSERWKQFRIQLLNQANVQTLEPLLVSLLMDTRDYMVQQYDLITTSGEYNGYNYPSLFHHFLQEMMYFVKKISGVSFTLEDELKFWNDTSEEHADMNHRMTDVTETRFDTLNQQFAQQFQSLGHVQDVTDLFHASKSLHDQFDECVKTMAYLIDMGSYQGVIHPMFIQHLMREQQRAQYVLAQWDASQTKTKLTSMPNGVDNSDIYMS